MRVNGRKCSMRKISSQHIDEAITLHSSSAWSPSPKTTTSSGLSSTMPSTPTLVSTNINTNFNINNSPPLQHTTFDEKLFWYWGEAPSQNNHHIQPALLLWVRHIYSVRHQDPNIFSARNKFPSQHVEFMGITLPPFAALTSSNFVHKSIWWK